MPTGGRGNRLFSLRIKLLAALVPVMLISVVLSMVGLGQFLKDNYHASAESETGRLGRAIRSMLRPAMLRNSVDGLSDALAALGKDPTLRRVWIIDKKGRVGHAADKTAVGRVLDKSSDPICTVCHRRGNVPTSQTYFTRDETGVPVLRHVRPILNEEDCWGCHDSRQRLNGILLVEESTQSFEDAVRTVQVRLGAAGAVTLVVLVALTLVVTTLIVERPVRALRAGVREIGAGNLAARIPVRGRDELAELAGSVNQMAEDLTVNVEELRNKNSELSIVYSIVEQLTKTINLGELKEIVLQTLMDVLAADRVMLVSHLTQSGSGETLIRSRQRKRLGRILHGEEAGRVLPDDVPAGISERWLRGEPQDSAVTADGRLLVLAVRGADSRSALLLIERARPFEPGEVTPKLLRALGDHIRVALENARLFTLAITDDLTQLFTVRHFRVRVEDAFFEYQQRRQGFSVLMLDLDFFKSVNDRFGHPAGDEVLRQVAQVLRDSVRPVDSAYRYGGEEFVVLLPETDSASARKVAERVRVDVEALRVALGGGVEVGVTVSIGIASCPADGVSYDELVSVADGALYNAKHAGRNRVWDPSTQA